MNKEVVKTCFDEIGITKEEMYKNKDDKDEEGQEKHQCFLKCLGEKTGIIQKDGKIDLHKMKVCD